MTLLMFMIFPSSNYCESWYIENGKVFKNGVQFFPIGLWGIPQYQFKVNKVDNDAYNIDQFKEANLIFNLFYVPTAREQAYMRDAVLLTGWGHLNWRLKAGYIGEDKFKPDRDGNNKLDIKEMRFIKNSMHLFFRNYFKNHIVGDIRQRFKDYNFIWLLADEANSGFQDWYWYPQIIRGYHQAVKSVRDSSITFVDLFGTIRGDRLSYELNYLKKFGQIPTILPQGKGQDLLEGDLNNLNTYNYSADGTPVYVYNEVKSVWEYNETTQFGSKFYHNIYQAASAYDDCADVLGVNCYYDFYHFPEAAGITVDAIKDACGKEKPVWIFFDGAGHAKPKNMSSSEYLKVVKCQVYTAIVHGASGILFWSKETTSEEYWNSLKQLSSELKKNSEIFKSNRIKFEIYNKIHYAVFELDNNNKYLLAVNTSKLEPLNFNLIENVNTIIKPLEVKIVEL